MSAGRSVVRVALRLSSGLILVIVPAMAGGQSGRSVGVSGGVALPVRRLAQTARPGFHVEAYVAFERPDRPFSFRATGFAAQLSGEAVPVGGGPDRYPTERIFALTADVVYRGHWRSLRPFALLAVGPYIQNGYIAQNNVGASIGVGLELARARSSLTAEVRYHQALTANGPRRLQLVSPGVGIRF